MPARERDKDYLWQTKSYLLTIHGFVSLFGNLLSTDKAIFY